VGVPQQTLIYTVSISFRKSTFGLSGVDLATGSLDGRVVVSFGMSDRTSHFLEVELQEMLKDHDMCEDIIQAGSLALVTLWET